MTVEEKIKIAYRTIEFLEKEGWVMGKPIQDLREALLSAEREITNLRLDLDFEKQNDQWSEVEACND